jgi:hypothetical protein
MHRLPREVLWKRDRHRTSTKFRFGVINWHHELFKCPSYIFRNFLLFRKYSGVTALAFAPTPVCGIAVKGKGNVSLCFNWAPRHEGVLGIGGIAPLILWSALDGGEWSASRASRFNPRERATCTHWIGGWVGPRGNLSLSFNWVPCHEGVLEEWRYRSTHSWPRH